MDMRRQTIAGIPCCRAIGKRDGSLAALPDSRRRIPVVISTQFGSLSRKATMATEIDWDKVVGTGEAVRRVFESCPTILVGFQGPDHRYIAANAAARAVFPKIAADGTSIREVLPAGISQQIYEVFDRAYQTGEPQTGFEWRIQADADRSGVAQELFFDFLASPRRGPDGSIEGIQVAAADVTARVRDRIAAQARIQDMSKRCCHATNSTTVMQQALLAPSVPLIPGADIAAQYLVAANDTATGGDWFDAIALGGGKLVLIVGDVVGHGMEAAAVMSQLRTALRMQIVEGNQKGRGVTEALDAVDQFCRHVPGSKSSTMCVCFLDVATGEFRYCTAGHPPPLIVSADTTSYLEPSGAGPLGSGIGFPVRTETLGIGDTILLYTDGLIERPGRSLTASTTEFADLATEIANGGGFPLNPGVRPVDRLCSQTLELLLRTTGYNDDITLLATQRCTPTPPLRITADASVLASHTVRTRLRDWLSTVGTDPTDSSDLVHAISEFVENAAQHAYPIEVPEGIMIEAMLDGFGNVRASVTDHGQWREHHAGDVRMGRGRGLAMAEALVDQVRITHDRHGTTAALTRRLSRPAKFVTHPRLDAIIEKRPRGGEFVATANNAGHIVVAGDIDSRAASTLGQQIAIQSRAGTAPLTINLGAVTHLGSAGVSALADAHHQARRHGTDCVLLAPPGSPAHHVLSLVQLPVVTGGDDVLAHG